jgi:hypothetical protein
VAQICNPSYSGGRDQEDCGLRPYLKKFFNPDYLFVKYSGKNPRMTIYSNLTILWEVKEKTQ